METSRAVARPGFILGNGRGRVSVGYIPGHLQEKIGADAGKGIGQRARRLVPMQGDSNLRQGIPCVEPHCELLDRDASFTVSCKDGSRDGGRPPIQGQKRWMEVDAAARKQVKELLFEDFSVRYDDQEVRRQFFHRLDGRRVKRGRSQHRYPKTQCRLLYGGRARSAPAANRSVWRRQCRNHAQLAGKVLQ